MNTKIPMSKRKKSELERELEFLRTVRSREVAAMIEEAKEYGDLLENAEYEAAEQERQRLCGRIAQMEEILRCAVVAEEKCFSDEFLAELKKVILACGLSAKQAEAYAKYCRTQFELQDQKQYGILPAAPCLETLKEAQRILSGKKEPAELNEYAMDRFLRIPADQWRAAKAAVMECFGVDQETVDALFNQEEELLLLSKDTVNALAEDLKAVLPDAIAAWKVFRNAALLGKEAVKARIFAVLDLLGEEFGKQVIHTDAAANEWLFWRYYSDPVGCIAYMKACGLPPEKILRVIQEESAILHMYKIDRRVSYGHDQAHIDEIIRRYH